MTQKFHFYFHLPDLGEAQGICAQGDMREDAHWSTVQNNKNREITWPFLKCKMEYNTAVKITELDLHLPTWQMYHVSKNLKNQ